MLFVSIMVGYANTEYNDVKRGAFEDPLFATRSPGSTATRVSLVDKAGLAARSAATGSTGAARGNPWHG
jgi:hypothetical protein